MTGNPTYFESFKWRREIIKGRIDDLTGLIVNSSGRRKRVMTVQEVVESWLTTIAPPEIAARREESNALARS